MTSRLFRLLPGLLVVACASGGAEPEAPPAMLRGVNLAGADFGEQHLPGLFGADYIYPTHEEIDYFVSKGMNVFRIPFRWERLQQNLGEDFDADERARLEGVVSYATGRGAHVVLDPHNYARYFDVPIGEGAVTVESFAAFWRRLAWIFGGNHRVVFGLMNEPHDIRAETWLAAANAAIAAIRRESAVNLVLVPGTNWTGAWTWYQDMGFGANAPTFGGVIDPANNFAIEVHQYLDADSSGEDSECVAETIGSDRLWPVTAWLRARGIRGFLGEFGAAGNQRCLAALDDLLRFVDDHADAWAGWTYWAAGPWWGDYRFSIEPDGGMDRPQMGELSKHLPAR